MKISFEKCKELCDKLEHLQFLNSDNNSYWKYASLYKDVCWYVYFNRILGHEYVEFDTNLCDRLCNLINDFKEVIDNETN